jgi:hypothetical protein
MVPQRLSHGNTVTTERIHGQTIGVILLRYPPALAHHCFYNVANGPTRRPRTRRNGNRNLRSSGHCGNQLFLGSCQTTLAISRPRIISIMCILRRRHRRRDARFVQLLFEKHVVITSVFVRLRLLDSFKDVMRLLSYFHFLIHSVCALTGVGAMACCIAALWTTEVRLLGSRYIFSVCFTCASMDGRGMDSIQMVHHRLSSNIIFNATNLILLVGDHLMMHARLV